MKKLLTALLLISSPAIFAQNGEKNFIDQNYIEVTGKAEMEVAPDEIYIRIIISEKDAKSKELPVTEKAMLDKLKEIGFDLSKDLAVKDQMSNFQYYWFAKADVQLSKTYELVAHDAASAGRVFIELQKLGISNVTIEKVESSKITEYRRAVKIAAIQAAREKAQALAQAINQEIGKAIFIQEQDNNNLRYSANSMQTSNIVVHGYVSGNDINSSEPEVEFEKINLEYSIFVRFELK
jgi:uncharacterized protein